MKFIKDDRKKRFPENDWFYINFQKFIHSDSKMIEFINKKNYTIGEEKLSSRVLNHWYQKGIILDDRPNKKGWKKFSFSEIVWITIIKKLRGFGLNLQKIKEVKQQIDFYNIKEKKSKCPLLDFYIIFAINSKMPVKFIVFESGQTEILRQIDLDYYNQFELIKDDFISIDINKLLDKILINKNVKADYLNYNKTEIEQEVWQSQYVDKDKSITIKLNNGKDFIINKEKILSSKKEMESFLNKIKYVEGLITKQGKNPTFKIYEKKKIKK